jgi:hypothetical protein
MILPLIDLHPHLSSNYPSVFDLAWLVVLLGNYDLGYILKIIHAISVVADLWLFCFIC